MQKNSEEISCRQLNPLLRGANYFSSDSINFGPRYNYGYQILYVFSGKGEGVVEGKKYKLQSGDFFLYGPGDCHKFTAIAGQELVLATLYFSLMPESMKLKEGQRGCSEKLDKDFYRYADKHCRIESLPDIPFHLSVAKAWRGQLESKLRAIGEGDISSDASEFLHFKATLLDVFYQIQQIYNKRFPAGSDKISGFKRFVEDNFRKDINRKTASIALGISESYLTTLLRKHLATNFTEYLTQYRLLKARDLVLYSNMLVKEIASNVGFNDTSYFVLQFRKYYSKSPMQLRQQLYL